MNVQRVSLVPASVLVPDLCYLCNNQCDFKKYRSVHITPLLSALTLRKRIMASIAPHLFPSLPTPVCACHIGLLVVPLCTMHSKGFLLVASSSWDTSQWIMPWLVPFLCGPSLYSDVISLKALL